MSKRGRSRYGSILHEYGLKALGYFLTTFKKEMNPQFNNQFVLDAADFTLKSDSHLPKEISLFASLKAL